MNLKQMFPSKTLDGEDLYHWCRLNNNGQPVCVTIERLDYKTVESDMGEPGLAYYLHTREFSKPFKLSRTRADTIAEVLKSDETDHWIGRTIMVKGDRITVQKQHFWIVQPIIDPPPPKSPLLFAKQDITGAAFVEANVHGRPMAQIASQAPIGMQSAAIGVDVAVKVLDGLNLINKTFTDFVAWAHTSHPELYTAINGKALPDLPESALQWLRQFCAMFPRINPPFNDAQKAEARAKLAPPKVTGDVIDPKTGAVATDDIPF